MQVSRIVFCTYLDTDKSIYQRLMPGFFRSYIDETVRHAATGHVPPCVDHTAVPQNTACGMQEQWGESLCVCRLEKSMHAMHTDFATANPAMPPPTATQSSAKRKRGRPPKTPTKGPSEKQLKASVENARRTDGATPSMPQQGPTTPQRIGLYFRPV